MRRFTVGESIEAEGKHVARVALELSGSGEQNALLSLIGDSRGVRSVNVEGQEDLD